MSTFTAPILFEGGGAGIQRQPYTINHDDFTAAATSETVDLATDIPAGLVMGAKYRVPEAFAAPTASAATIDVGISGGNTDQYVDAVDVTAATTYAYTPGDGTAPVPQAATTLSVTLALTGDNVADTTAGQIIVDVYYFGGNADPDDQ